MKKMPRIFLLLLMVVSTLGMHSCSKSAISETQASPASTQLAAEAPAEQAATTTPSENLITTTGTFMNLEMGDYMHLNMKSDQGEELSFFVLDVAPEELSVLEEPGSEGKKIEVKWRTVTKNIPEAGGEMELDELVSVRVIE